MICSAVRPHPFERIRLQSKPRRGGSGEKRRGDLCIASGRSASLDLLVDLKELFVERGNDTVPTSKLVSLLRLYISSTLLQVFDLPQLRLHFIQGLLRQFELSAIVVIVALDGYRPVQTQSHLPYFDNLLVDQASVVTHAHVLLAHGVDLSFHVSQRAQLLKIDLAVSIAVGCKQHIFVVSIREPRQPRLQIVCCNLAISIGVELLE